MVNLLKSEHIVASIIGFRSCLFSPYVSYRGLSADLFTKHSYISIIAMDRCRESIPWLLRYRGYVGVGILLLVRICSTSGDGYSTPFYPMRIRLYPIWYVRYLSYMFTVINIGMCWAFFGALPIAFRMIIVVLTYVEFSFHTLTNSLEDQDNSHT